MRRSLDNHPLAGLCRTLAWVLPLVVGVLNASARPLWASDMALVQGVGLVPLPGRGALSSMLIQLTTLLPIGGRSLRAALVGALGLALLGAACHAAARAFLESSAVSRRVAPPLALAVALLGSLAPTALSSGTLPSGTPIAAAIVIAGLTLLPSQAPLTGALWASLGVALGLLVGESPAAALALVLVVSLRLVLHQDLPSRRSLLAAGAFAGVAGAIVNAPLLLRNWTSRSWVDLGRNFRSGFTTPVKVRDFQAIFDSWQAEFGVILSATAIAGLVFGLLDKRSRPIALGAGTLLALETFAPRTTGQLAPDAWAAVHVAGAAAAALLAGLGVERCATLLSRARIPWARQVSTLLVALTLTLMLLTYDDAKRVADSRTQSAAEVWTDEALGSLPPHSLVLISSPSIAWRLWAARAVRGQRPDVVLVPMSYLGRGSLAAQLLSLEPELAELVKDMAMEGQASEYALSRLADVRPLYVDLDPHWDKRLLEHLAPEGLWLRFAPHAIGRSDRSRALERGREVLQKVLKAARAPAHPDAATLTVLRDRARQQTITVAALGEREHTRLLLEELELVDPADPLLKVLKPKAADETRSLSGQVKTSELLAWIN